MGTSQVTGKGAVITAEKKPLDAMQLMESYKDQIQKALPKHMSADRVARIALTEMRKNPKLMQCDPFSILGAVIQSAQLGLEVGSGLGHAYLVPYKAECTLITGYKGMADLARRGGRVKDIAPYLVYPEDRFDEGVRDGAPYLDYVAARLGKVRDPATESIGAFVTAGFDNGARQWAYMEKWEIERIREGLRYPSDIWQEHWGEMAKKTVLRRLSKLLPQSPELVQANQLEDGERRSVQPFIDIGVLTDGYEEKGPEHDPAKINAEREGAGANDHQLSHEKKAAEEKSRNELDVAILDFQDALTAAKDRKVDIKAILKVEPIEVVKMPAERIRAATKLIVDAMKK